MDEAGCPYVDIAPQGVHKNDSFHIRLTIGWRSLRGEFLPGAYAAPMVREMGSTHKEDKAVFSALIFLMRQEKSTLSMQVNKTEFDPCDPDEWPTDWERLSLEFEKTPLAVNTENSEDTEKSLLHWGSRFIAAILALVPLEELEDEIDTNPEGLPEGTVTRIAVNRYERSRFNRAACIEIHGHACKACKLDFGEQYGPIGEGFIHVHHVTPVSEIGPDYRINPATDLIPLCPNCHAIVHKYDTNLDFKEICELPMKPISR